MSSTMNHLLGHLDRLVIEMGDRCVEALKMTIEALKTGNRECVMSIVNNDDKIDDLESEIDSICLKILLREQPFARDLRRVIAAAKLVTDLERIGDQAADIADIALMLDLGGKGKFPMIEEMAEKTCEMVSGSIQAFVGEDITLTKTIIEADEEIDNLFLKIRYSLVMQHNQNMEARNRAIDIIMVTKYLERIADHATNVAEWVEFSITGVHPSYVS